MELEIKHTSVFQRNWEKLNDEDLRFIINQGGTRSSKTYSICQMLIVYCLMNEKKIVSIVRKSFPALRSSVMRDFMEVMKELNIYKAADHHKTENVYNFPNGSAIEFFSADDEQKLRGRKRDILWANEANELSFDEYNQLNMRTSDKLIFDFNPSDDEHWLYDLIERDNSTLIKSTYTDNPFLSEEQVKEIEHLISVDENYYKIYALGEKPTPTTRIFTHFKQYSNLPEKIDDIIYGVDWGFNHPTALVKVYLSDGRAYVEELIYKSHLTSSDIVNEFSEVGVDKSKHIYSDYARPEIIEDLKRAGYNMKESNKEVKAGINSLKQMEIFIHQESSNIWKEFKRYSWKTKGEQVLDEPVKIWDDALDALRYAIHSNKKKVYNSKFSSFYSFK